MLSKSIRAFWMSSILISVLTLAAFSLSGCNLYSSLDEPEEDFEIREAAIVAMEANKCADAIKLYQGKTNLSDEDYHILGWAKMCNAGASISKVAGNIFSYSSSTGNLELIGALANTMIPSDATKVTAFTDALSSFNQIQNANTRTVDMTLGYLVKASAIVAKSYSLDGDLGSVKRADISSNCTSDCTTCTAGLTNADATELRSNITSAAQTASSVAGLGSVKELSDQLQTQVGATDQATRCAVYYQFFAN